MCALNSRSRIIYADNQFKLQGEPTEAALKVLAEKLGNYAGNPKHDAKKSPMAYSERLESEVTRVATLEFSSERKTMSTIITGYEGNSGNTVLLKGAPERVIKKCKAAITVDGAEKSLSEADKANLVKRIQKVAAEGYRVLGIAIGLDGANMKDVTKENAGDKLVDTAKYDQLESNLSFVGYVCIKDPVRPEVRESINECKTAGINVIMITGDSKETAISIARELDIIVPGQNTDKSCFTGAEFEDLNEKQKIEALGGRHGKVFSRVEPRHKRELVKLLIQMVRSLMSLFSSSLTNLIVLYRVRSLP